MKKPIIVGFKKLGKFDKICSKCGRIIKGALRETMAKGDDIGMICSDDKNYWHRKCENEKNSIKENRKKE